MSWQSAKGRLDFVGENESTVTVCRCESKERRGEVCCSIVDLLTCWQCNAKFIEKGSWGGGWGLNWATATSAYR